jgi:uncharacterized protein
MLTESVAQRFGLREIVIERIHGVFQKFPGLEKAVLYGSRAKGNYRVGSDIDLTLFGSDLTYPILATIENLLDDLMLPYTFDISLFSQIENQDLVSHIVRVGVDFYAKQEKSRANVNAP